MHPPKPFYKNYRDCVTLAILAGLGLLGTSFNIPLFFGIDFLLGSIFIFLALLRFGLLAGIIASAIAGSYTIILWHHPYALIGLILEILFVGIALRRNPDRNLPTAVMIYWLTIGLAVIALSYRFFLDVPWHLALMVAFKQAVNDIFNALIATLALQFLPANLLFGLADHRLKKMHHIQTNLLVAFAFLPALTVILISARQTVIDSETSIKQRVAARSAYISAQLVTWQNENVQMLNAVAKHDSTASLHDLQLLQSANPDLLFLHQVDSNGNIRLSTQIHSDVLKKINFSDRSWFRTLIATGKPVFSDAIVGRTSGLATIAIAVPILKDNQIIGIMLTSVKPEALLARITAGNNVLGTRITLTDRNGTIITSTEPDFKPMHSFEKDRGGIIKDQDGQLYRIQPRFNASAMQAWGNSYYAQNNPLSQSGWSVIIEQPLRPYSVALEQIHLLSFITTFLLALVAFLLGSRAGRLISGPLSLLSLATNKLSRNIDSQDDLILPKSNVQEIAALTDDFRRMAQTLRNYYTDLSLARNELEQRVTQRTSELQGAEQLLQENKQLVDSIVENIPAMIFMKRADNLQFVLINKAGEELTGISRQDFIGKTDYDFFPKEQADAFIAKDKAALARGFEDIPEEPIDTKSRGQRILHTKKITLRDNQGNPQFLLGISHDITDRKNTETQLIIAKEDAEQANRAKSDFLASMSHELRTPLNGILGFAQLLQYDRNLEQTQQESIQEIIRAGKHLLNLINDILDLARVEAGTIALSIEPVNCSELANEIIALTQPLAMQRKISLTLHNTLPTDLLVMVDHTRLRQILLNLFSNAIKYNFVGGKVELSLRQDSQQVFFTVKDTGAGIPIARQAELFQTFNRLGAEGGTIEGTGIGLVISKQLTELMGGTIGFNSEPGVGSEFWVTIPLTGNISHIHNDTIHQQPAPTVTNSTGTILYIEDNPSNLRLMTSLIAQRPKLHLITAHEPRLGIDLACAHLPDMILLDINLPGMDGFEVLRHLRNHPVLASRPIIAVSANAMEKDIEKAIAAGFDTYVTKPINIESFLQMLDKFLPA